MSKRICDVCNKKYDVVWAKKKPDYVVYYRAVYKNASNCWVEAQQLWETKEAALKHADGYRVVKVWLKDD